MGTFHSQLYKALKEAVLSTGFGSFVQPGVVTTPRGKGLDFSEERGQCEMEEK